MWRWRQFFLKFSAFLRRSRAEAEMTREVQSHLALMEDEFQRRGMLPEDARLAARRAFGGVDQAKELHRDERSFLWLDHARQDVRYGLRTLARNPWFTIAAVVTLALGIGASTSIFSVVNGVLLLPLPYKDPDRIVRVVQHWPFRPAGLPLRLAAINIGDLQQLRARTQTLSQMAAFVQFPFVLRWNGETIRVTAEQVSPSMFSLLGAEPLLGRVFDPAEESPGRDAVVVLSHSAWRKYFAGDPLVLGRTMTLSLMGMTKSSEARDSVIGVMPETFEFPDRQTELWMPFVLTPVAGESSLLLAADTIARLKDGMSIESATAEMNALFRQFRQRESEPVMPGPGPAGMGRGMPPPPPGPGGSAPPADNALQDQDRDASLELVNLKDELVAPVRPALLVLLVAVGFVLVIACANVANLLLARSAGRQAEIAIRAALGAGRMRLIRQALTESVMLALLGGSLGILLAFGGVHLLTAIGPADIPHLEDIRIDTTVLGFTLALSVLTGLLFGLVPALRLASFNPMTAMKEGNASRFSGTDLFRRNRTRSLLAVSEIAVAMVLLAGAGLLLNSFAKLSTVNPGYDPRNLLTFQIARSGEHSEVEQQAFSDDLVERLESWPDVQSAAVTSTLPLQPFMMRLIVGIPGRPQPSEPGEELLVSVRFISPKYVETIGIAQLEGRALRGEDRPGQPQVVLVNKAFADRYFSDGTVLGNKLNLTGPVPWQIVGVVGDVRNEGLDSEPRPEIYMSLWQAHAAFPPPPGGDMLFAAIRTGEDPTPMVASIRGIIQTLDPQATIDKVATMEQRIADSVARPRFYAAMLGIFAAIAVAVAAVGIYGLMAYSVSQRTREMGIRIALGAERRAVLQLVLRQGLILTGIGISLGFIGAVALTRYLKEMLFGLTPTDPATLAAVAAVLVIVAILAVYIPARRAAKIDPIVALRYE